MSSEQPDAHLPANTSSEGRQEVSPPAEHPPAETTRESHRSRAGGLWTVMIVAAVILLLLLIFVLQNGQRVLISFLGAQGHMPLGVALLLAAISGALIVAIPGTGRILQLRRENRRQRRQLP